MKRTLLVLVAVTMLVVGLQGQTTADSRGKGRPASPASISDRPGTMAVTMGDMTPIPGLKGSLGPPHIRCDELGDLYIFVAPPTADLRFSYVQRIRPDGTMGVTFSKGLKRRPLFDAVGFGLRGEVVMLPTAYGRTSILRFSPKGELESEIPFGNEPALVGSVAPYPDGNILVSHREKTHAITGIYDREGKLVTMVRIPDDEEIEKAIANRDPRYVSPLYPDQTNRAVDGGVAVAGRDGNVYLMRYGDPAFVYAIDTTGKIVRRLAIKAPAEGMMPFNMQIRNGMIVFYWEDTEMHNAVVTVTDWKTGRRLKTFDLAGTTGYFGCYDPTSDQLTFIGKSKDDYAITIGTARPVVPPTAANH